MTDQAFYDGLAEELLGRLNRLRSFTRHAPSIGAHHEEILRETIRGMISPRFQLRTGFSFAEQSVVSRQGDILIVDEMDPAPYFFRQGDLVVVQPRALVAVIEVKTTLERRSFAESIDNLASFQVVADKVAPERRPITFLFAFDGPRLSAKRMHEWYVRIKTADELKYYPRAMLVLKRGLMFMRLATQDKPHGHYFMSDPKAAGVKAKELSVFLASLRKGVELRAGVKSNPFQHAIIDNLHWSEQSLRFGRGLHEPDTVPKDRRVFPERTQ
jgi:hypothetical protein